MGGKWRPQGGSTCRAQGVKEREDMGKRGNVMGGLGGRVEMRMGWRGKDVEFMAFWDMFCMFCFVQWLFEG